MPYKIIADFSHEINFIVPHPLVESIHIYLWTIAAHDQQ